MLYSYKMTDDTGFAPNPFHGTMTLANCKPLIRLKKDKGDFIAGFTSKKLCGERIEKERLVYIMKVTEKLSYADYFNDDRFKCKIPSNQSRKAKAGDNIYEPSKNAQSGFVQLENWNHKIEDMCHDLKGEYVLLSTEFYYFGVGAILIDDFPKIKIPKVQSGNGVKTDDMDEIDKLWSYLSKHKQKNVALNPPHYRWKENEPFN